MNVQNDLYFDLLQRCLMNSVYAKHEFEEYCPQNEDEKSQIARLNSQGLHVMKPRKFDSRLREEGKEWPPYAHSMIGRKRLENIRFCIEEILNNKVPGDLIETGVWRGGACIYMRAILRVYGVEDRCVWVADSFAGLPPPNADAYPADEGLDLSGFKELAVSLDTVKQNFEAYGMLDERVRFLKGWFRDTLPSAPIDKLALIRLDGDLYESTMDGLIHLYPKLSKGGYVIVDDYGVLEPCRKAVEDYRNTHGISDQIRVADWTGVFWQKT